MKVFTRSSHMEAFISGEHQNAKGYLSHLHQLPDTSGTLPLLTCPVVGKQSKVTSLLLRITVYLPFAIHLDIQLLPQNLPVAGEIVLRRSAQNSSYTSQMNSRCHWGRQT